jgi:two-component system chemotaxis response regulator CheB
MYDPAVSMFQRVTKFPLRTDTPPAPHTPTLGDMETQRIKVFIVDDALSMRLLLGRILGQAPDIEVVGTAADPLQAREMLRALDPDVITLDVEMPGMDGLTFLQKLMALKPMPVVMISTLTAKGSATALRALELGAVEVVGKPSSKPDDVARCADDILTAVRAAARARIGPRARHLPDLPGPLGALGIDDLMPRRPALPDGPPLLALGASTGGPEALRQVLAALPPHAPGVVVAQHMPPVFMTAFAARLDKVGPLRVAEARHGQPIRPGHVYLAPGDRHLAIQREAGAYVCQLLDAEKINRHRPSVDVLFRSVANTAGASARAALLTGMGNDGAQGLKDLFDAGALTLAQDEASSVVFGMPRAAIALGGARKVVPLTDVAARLMS